MKGTVEDIKNALASVMDPELHISLVDLGLIYNIRILEDEKVDIEMTLTTLGCPLFNVIESDIRKAIASVGYKPEQVHIDLVFDPPWTMDRMSESAKAMLGI